MSALGFIAVIVFLILLQNILYEKYIFHNLEIKRSFDEIGVFPGESIIYRFSVSNKKLLPLVWLSIDQKLPHELEIEGEQIIEPCSDISFIHRLIFSVLPYQRINRRYKMKFTKRGYYQPKDITITSTNVLGSKTYEKEIVYQNNIAVYPNIRELGDEFIPANTMLGDFSVKRWIIDDPMMLIGVRDYQNTDSFKSINWKLTAKNQKLQVNKYDYTADKKIMLILNLDKQEYTLTSTDIELIEEAIEVGASLAVKLIENGIPTGVATNSICINHATDGVLEPDTGKEHISKLLTTFSQMTYMKKFKSRELLKLLIKDFSWGTEIIVLTIQPTDELMADLEAIGHINTSVIAFEEGNISNTPANVSLYYHRREGDKYAAV